MTFKEAYRRSVKRYGLLKTYGDMALTPVRLVGVVLEWVGGKLANTWCP